MQHRNETVHKAIHYDMVLLDYAAVHYLPLVVVSASSSCVNLVNLVDLPWCLWLRASATCSPVSMRKRSPILLPYAPCFVIECHHPDSMFD
ncbi:hypothetical protein HBH64_224610 [Parastagonospora nodorum]|nr:hypothetical protein HBH53_080420 [Parastagonospora nodorum]KAH4073527.1 hypothetical protein HBH50_055240 [Parastagonospora nodorum]KAH4099409.1 hypothetical protein HBH48_006880 [Parastagonospora nodorum]KAH4179723.1 hypothetical protein HBH43_021080 [Parastagonospora nodorum]KAH4200301.1 hypothetical protein HBH42_042260 [Parastagonospora nodorum]